MSDECLYVIDGQRPGRRPVDPSSVRCKPDGKVVCTPCLERWVRRCALSDEGYGCVLDAGHESDMHLGSDGHGWWTGDSWGWSEADE